MLKSDKKVKSANIFYFFGEKTSFSMAFTIRINSVHTSSNDLFDKEALHAAKGIREWYPAINRGEAVECEYFIPISFNNIGIIRHN